MSVAQGCRAKQWTGKLHPHFERVCVTTRVGNLLEGETLRKQASISHSYINTDGSVVG
jgi:hypothetical protein